MRLSEKKLDTETYTRYSGYPGGLYKDSMRDVRSKSGSAKLLEIAIRGMLPHNKLEQKFMRNLKIEN
jgi:large subunit ribosomal protein L13